MGAREEEIPVLYINDAHEKGDKEFEKWGEHCLKGSLGAHVVDELKPKKEDYIIEKKRFSGFYNTNLEKLLKDLGTREIYEAGLVTNICNLATGLDAKMRDYDVKIVKDAVKDLPDEKYNDNEYFFSRLGPLLGFEIVDTKQAIKEFKGEI